MHLKQQQYIRHLEHGHGGHEDGEEWCRILYARFHKTPTHNSKGDDARSECHYAQIPVSGSNTGKDERRYEEAYEWEGKLYALLLDAVV